MAQYTIVKDLAMLHKNICVVGDDAQSIYAFRGADIHNFFHFDKNYSALVVLKLEQNSLHRTSSMLPTRLSTTTKRS
jgi:DNA helicase II / ATP-dependent DNA helicase PcrA